MNPAPFGIPAAGVIVSFAGWVTSGSLLSLGFASARVTFAAGTPSTVDRVDLQVALEVEAEAGQVLRRRGGDRRLRAGAQLFDDGS